MPFNADAAPLTLLAAFAALVAGILGYAGVARIKARRAQRDIVVIRGLIIDYFRRSGVAVSADCIRLQPNGAFTALVESEPMKRFRLSHIIEMTLCEHVRKSCGLTLEKVYWRFPIREAAQAVAPSAAEMAGAAAGNGVEAPQADEVADDYINEGLENYRHIPRPEVTELPWETFEEMSTIGREKKDGQAAGE